MPAKQFTRKSIATAALQIVVYLLAFTMSPLVIGIPVGLKALAASKAPATQPYATQSVTPPTYDAAKPTVAFVTSNNGTEITDLLAPYAVFGASGAFNVYTVAPQRIFTPFMWGGLDFVPHYSFAELDNLLGKSPDVIVIPFISDPHNPEILQWIRSHAGPHTLVVSICGGALVLAGTGLVDHGQVTTHQEVFALIEKQYPHIQLVHGVRYTDNGDTVTSAGITAGIDASLHVVQRLLGKAAALATAQKLNYPYAQFLDDPHYQPPSLNKARWPMLANAGFLWQKSIFGVYLYDGVGEINLTAVLDTYQRTFTANTITFAEQRQLIRSSYGLYLVPRLALDQMPDLDRIIVPGSQGTLRAATTLATWAEHEQALPVEYLYPADTPQRFAFDATLTDLARWSSKTDAQSSSITLEYPIERQPLTGRQWPFYRLLTAVLLGAIGISLLFAVQKWWGIRRKVDHLQPA